MFTANWYKALTAACISNNAFKYTGYKGTPISHGTSSNYRAIPLLTPDFGSSESYAPRLDVVQQGISGDYGCGVIFGNGTTPPTLADYCLSGNIISGITATVGSTDVAAIENGVTLTTVYTIINNNSTAITIGEIGLVGKPYTNTTSTDEAYKALLERTVLETPVTIEPGTVGRVTYTITIQYPAA